MSALLLRYRGRDYTAEDASFIRALIAAHPGLTRRQLSAKLCEAWGWVQPNGMPRDMVARGLMLALHRAGHIELPAKKVSPPNNAIRHRDAPEQPSLFGTKPIVGPLSALLPVAIEQVRRSSYEKLFDGFVQRHHYLGYTRPVGEHLKYLVWSGGMPLACLAFSSSPRHIGCRDRFIGWSAVTRRAHVHLLAYNTRFLILPWVQVPHLASHLLGAVARRISGDWEALYKHPVYLLETFVDPDRFRGTCYRAANWQFVGMTTGVGKASRTKVVDRSLKQTLVYPLAKDFRRRLGVR
ncbi:MAG: DUF4338 domain-containing protein [Phycisphaerales bacterium]|jgi:hypothetical protein